MQDTPPTPDALGIVEVQLLDASSGRPIKSWVFEERSRISIGRMPEKDVEISDPYVSRNHADLVYEDGRWKLVSLGRNGILVANQFVTEHVVESDTDFRLGLQGPTLRFCKPTERTENDRTITFDSMPTIVLRLDQSKLQKEVGEIADGDYFRALQDRAKSLRRTKLAT